MIDIKSVLLDSSFCIRLLKSDADFHQNAVDYYEYFLENKIELYLSNSLNQQFSRRRVCSQRNIVNIA